MLMLLEKYWSGNMAKVMTLEELQQEKKRTQFMILKPKNYFELNQAKRHLIKIERKIKNYGKS